MSDVFRFKQFEIDQKGCAMRVNTDGVLLGAMATVESPIRVLDIGTGTGVIALMIAQRFSESQVTAIEIDKEAAATARRNFNVSRFAEQVTCATVALADFNPSDKYGLIVSNPPYFLQSLTNADARKRVARHTDMAFFDELLAKSATWLDHHGSLQLVLPPPLAQQVKQKASAEHGFKEQWEVSIRSFAGSTPVRKILSLGMEQGTGEKKDLIIYERQGKYSAAYRQLLQDFFLAF